MDSKIRENIITCMEIVINKGFRVISDLLYALETRVCIVTSVVQRMACVDPLLSPCVSLRPLLQ